MDPLWISAAFLFGFAVRQVGLPPLVGFLMAGFTLNAAGIEGGPMLENIADMGVTLLLFSIGLKLRIKSLLKPEIWAGASIHMVISVLLFGAAMYALGIAGMAYFGPLDIKLTLLVAFALSFSSTVFAVKVLEDRAEMRSFHGQVAIGILIIQDLLAVIFITASTGKLPSPWAILAVPGLFLLRPVLMHLMDRSGHGELMILCGFLMALVFGAGLFELVGLKADLGALFMGIMLAPHAKASEMAKHLLGFKDFFLIGFFLSIGLSGVPTLATFGVALLLVAVMPIKVALFFILLTRFKLRARTAVLASLNLANYSEFGLIVGAIALANGWLSGDWLVIVALALTMTFIAAAPLNARARAIVAAVQGRVGRFEAPTPLPEDAPIDAIALPMAIAGGWKTSLKQHRREHARLYNLRGDPALKLSIRKQPNANTVSVADQVTRANRVFAEAQVGNRYRAGFPGIVDEIALRMQVGGLANDLDRILVGAHGAVRTQAVENRLHGAGVRVGAETGIGVGAVSNRIANVTTVGRRPHTLAHRDGVRPGEQAGDHGKAPGPRLFSHQPAVGIADAQRPLVRRRPAAAKAAAVPAGHRVFRSGRLGEPGSQAGNDPARQRRAHRAADFHR